VTLFLSLFLSLPMLVVHLYVQRERERDYQWIEISLSYSSTMCTKKSLYYFVLCESRIERQRNWKKIYFQILLTLFVIVDSCSSLWFPFWIYYSMMSKQQIANISCKSNLSIFWLDSKEIPKGENSPPHSWKVSKATIRKLNFSSSCRWIWILISLSLSFSPKHFRFLSIFLSCRFDF